MKRLIIISLLLITNFSYSTEQSDFLKDCVEIFIKMDKATIDFENVLTNESDSDKIKSSIESYNETIVLYSLNKLVKYTKSENKEIKKFSDDLSKLLSDLVGNNYELLGLLTNSKLKKKELKLKSKDLIKKNRFASMFFNHITLGLIQTTLKDNGGKNVQISFLTKKEKNELDKTIEMTFDKSTKRDFKLVLKDNKITNFEKSCIMIYDFYKLEANWEFEK